MPENSCAAPLLVLPEASVMHLLPHGVPEYWDFPDEIIYLVLSYNFFSLQAISKELTNNGALTSKAIHGLVYHFD